MSLSTPSILAKLLLYLTNNVHSPLQVTRLGETLIERGWSNSSSDDGELQRSPAICCIR